MKYPGNTEETQVCFALRYTRAHWKVGYRPALPRTRGAFPLRRSLRACIVPGKAKLGFLLGLIGIAWVGFVLALLMCSFLFLFVELFRRSCSFCLGLPSNCECH